MAQTTARSFSSDDIASTITQLEEQWAAAEKANDPAKIALLLAEAFVGMDADGSMQSKSTIVARAKNNKWEINEVSGVKVVVHGTMAIATGAWHGKGTVDGKMVDQHERWLDTWLRNGKWACVASASTPVTA
jgi:ketosteroid isomerase-like protein